MSLKWLYQAQYAFWTWVLFTFCISITLPLVMIGIYNLYFHPLRNVPGPKLAALTNLYAFYWNWIRDEGYSRQFSALHKYYNSSIIRVGPNHVHTTQVELYDVIFKAGSKWRKEKSFYKYFNGLDAMIEPNQYRTYRTHLAPLYAQRAIDDLAPKIYGDLSISAARMIKMTETGKTINMVKVLRTLSTSMILHNFYSLDISLNEYDGYHPFLEAFEQLMTQSWLFVTYPMVPMLLGLIPGTRFAKFNSSYTTFMNYCNAWNDEDVRKQQASDDQSVRDSHMKRYLAIKNDDEQKKSIIPNPLDDVFNFIAGGSDTTSYTTACAFFYILSSPIVCTKLVRELDEHSSIIRDTFDYTKIQTLPYLNAVIKETLRISVPVPGCLPRVVPEGGVTLGSFSLPAGTAVSISQQAISFNNEIFSSSHSFIPERWIGPEAVGLDKWNIAFSRGPRQCIGTTLAYLELRSVLAYFFSRFEMTLTGNCGDRLRWVDRFVAVNLDDVEVLILRDRWG
uniref:Elymoclavine monooxygenase n=1 Tax=Periglandula ipomoeae TaxID=1037530 RepID=G9FM49_9HYPO|nr:elymoclavine monooxygenase [Periglandula ipomoeae]